MLIFNHNNQAILPLFIFSKTLDFKPFLYKFTSRRDFRQFFFQMALKPFVKKDFDFLKFSVPGKTELQKKVF